MKKKSFTLIELLVVIAIMGILAVIITVTVRASLIRAYDTQVKSDLSQMQKALEMYYGDNGEIYPRYSGKNYGGHLSGLSCVANSTMDIGTGGYLLNFDPNSANYCGEIPVNFRGPQCTAGGSTCDQNYFCAKPAAITSLTHPPDSPLGSNYIKKIPRSPYESKGKYYKYSCPGNSTNYCYDGKSYQITADLMGEKPKVPDEFKAAGLEDAFLANNTQYSATNSGFGYTSTLNGKGSYQGFGIEADENQSVDEGNLLSFIVKGRPSADFKNSPNYKMAIIGLPSGATFTESFRMAPDAKIIDRPDILDYTFSWAPNYDQAGNYNITIKYTDGISIVSKGIKITVNDKAPHPPSFTSNFQDYNIPAGSEIRFTIDAQDAGTSKGNLIFTTENVPSGATVSKYSSYSTGSSWPYSFYWIPKANQAGTYNIGFKVSDGLLEDNRIVKITVTNDPNSFGADKVLIVVNDNSPGSLEVGDYYQQKRGVPANQVAHIHTTTDWIVNSSNYYSEIEQPIKNYLESNNLKDKILYIVPTYGVPVRVDDQAHLDQCKADDSTTCTSSAASVPKGIAFSVDSYLSSMYIDKTEGSNFRLISNPYSKISWGSYNYFKGPFAPGSRFNKPSGMYLVSRLDGPSPEIAKGLVDKAIYAEKYVNKNYGNAYEYGFLGGGLLPSPESTSFCANVQDAGYSCSYDNGTDAVSNPLWRALWGFCGPSWHQWEIDTKTCLNTDHSIIQPASAYCSQEFGYKNWGTFLPGGIGIHIRSYTGFRNLRDIPSGIIPAYFLADDITGTTGTIDEPYLNGLPDPVSFFNFFLNGNPEYGITHFNYAESMYMSMDYLYWRIYIVGDPLYMLSDSIATDDEAPKLENIHYSYSGNSATIEWDNPTSITGSPEVTYGGVQYGLDNTYGSEAWEGTYINYYDQFKKNAYSHHKITLSGLDTSREYFIKINAIDPNGNNSTKDFTIHNSTSRVDVP